MERDFAELLVLTSQQIRRAIEVVVGQQRVADVGSAFLGRQDAIRSLVEGIRRKLIVHTAVRGREVDFPLLLVWMSITKDVDRIGHLASYLWQMSLVETTLDRQTIAELVAAGETAVTFVTEIPDLLASQDSSSAERLLY